MSQKNGFHFEDFRRGAMIASAIIMAQLGMLGAQVADPVCTGTTITCNLPSFSSGSYVVLDASDVPETNSSCTATVGTTQLIIDITPDPTCHYTRVVEGSNIKDTVKLSHVEAAAGSIISGTDLNNQGTVVLCSCTSPLSATAETNFAASTGAPTVENVSAEGTFDVTAALYLDNTFSSPVAAGGSIPSGTSRLYMEFTSGSSADIVGVDSCTASPEASSSSSPFEVSFLGTASSCAAPGGGADLGVKYEADSDSNKVRISTVNFKFAGSSGLYIWCTVTRCVSDANSCGSCNVDNPGPSSRRLRVNPPRRLGAPAASATEETAPAAPRDLQESSAQAQIFLAVQPGGEGEILPGDISSSNSNVEITVLWQQDTPTDGAWTNFTLYGSPTDVSETFLEGLAQAFSEQMGPVLKRDVHVRRILGLHTTARRLSGAAVKARRLGSSTALEALVAECVVSVEYSGLARAQADTHANTTRETLSREILTKGGWSSTNLFVVPSEFVFRGSVASSSEDSNTGSDSTATIAMAIAAAACGALGCACALFVAQIYLRKRECRVIVISSQEEGKQTKGGKAKRQEGNWLAPLPAF